MTNREELKNAYIETCIRIEQMQREAAAASAEWRKLLKNARKKRDALLSRIANTDADGGDAMYTPPLPSAGGDDHDAGCDDAFC